MGGGIAQVFAMAGLSVAIADADPATTQRHLERLRREAEEFEAQGLFDPGSADLVRANIRAADSLPEAVGQADLIEEAVLEQPEVKGPVLKRIEEAARPDAIIGTNTSTIPIGDLVANLSDGQRFLGVHFSNPAPFIPGVELIAHAGTDEEAVRAVEAVMPRIGKLSARVNDKAGFVLNRLQYVLLKEAINLVEEGVATAEDIDIIVRTTFGYRLPFFGPFAIADMAGLDVYQACFRTFEEHYGERLSSPQMLTELVSAGHYGVKQGGGFVVPAGDQAPLIAYRNTAYARLGQLLRELGPAPLQPLPTAD
jgi:3-hydroxybutyryl-CoA dehydrogenase